MGATASGLPGRISTGCCAIATMAAQALGDGPPATMTFQDQSDRVTATVEEQAGNWKVVHAGDFDRDDDLDVVIAVGNQSASPRRNKLYRNDNGNFTEVSGMAVMPDFADADRSCNATFADFDGDCWLDILIVNDFQGALVDGVKVYMNRQVDGRFSHFEDESFLRLPDLGIVIGSRAAVVFDADNDGDLDFFVGTAGAGSLDSLFRNDGQGFFSNVTLTHLPPDTGNAIDVEAADLNGDGLADLVMSNRAPDAGAILYNGLVTERTPRDAGDFSGPVAGLPPAGDPESAIVAADLDGPLQGAGLTGSGSGGVDLYYGNQDGDEVDNETFQDGVLRNLGPDEQGMAVLEFVPVPQQVSSQISCKPSAEDLNGDGRKDIVVTAAFARPVILRNTSVGGVVSFVDWTPHTAFPGEGPSAWDVEIFDSNDDGDPDIFFGAYAGEHLYEQISIPAMDETDVTSSHLDAVFNGDPIAIVGRDHVGGADVFTLGNVGAGGFVSVVLNGPDDYRLEVQDGGLQVLGASDRGDLGVEEALQIDASGVVSIRVEILDTAATAADVNDDDRIDVLDLVEVIVNWGPCLPGPCPADTDGSGVVDVEDLVQIILFWGPVADNDYLLEVLARN